MLKSKKCEKLYLINYINIILNIIFALINITFTQQFFPVQLHTLAVAICIYNLFANTYIILKIKYY
jgi:hypothetical protein